MALSPCWEDKARGSTTEPRDAIDVTHPQTARGNGRFVPFARNTGAPVLAGGTAGLDLEGIRLPRAAFFVGTRRAGEEDGLSREGFGVNVAAAFDLRGCLGFFSYCNRSIAGAFRCQKGAHPEKTKVESDESRNN